MVQANNGNIYSNQSWPPGFPGFPSVGPGTLMNMPLHMSLTSSSVSIVVSYTAFGGVLVSSNVFTLPACGRLVVACNN